MDTCIHYFWAVGDPQQRYDPDPSLVAAHIDNDSFHVYSQVSLGQVADSIKARLSGDEDDVIPAGRQLVSYLESSSDGSRHWTRVRHETAAIPLDMSVPHHFFRVVIVPRAEAEELAEDSTNTVGTRLLSTSELMKSWTGHLRECRNLWSELKSFKETLNIQIAKNGFNRFWGENKKGIKDRCNGFRAEICFKEVYPFTSHDYGKQLMEKILPLLDGLYSAPGKHIWVNKTTAGLHRVDLAYCRHEDSNVYDDGQAFVEYKAPKKFTEGKAQLIDRVARARHVRRVPKLVMPCGVMNNEWFQPMLIQIGANDSEMVAWEGRMVKMGNRDGNFCKMHIKNEGLKEFVFVMWLGHELGEQNSGGSDSNGDSGSDSSVSTTASSLATSSVLVCDGTGLPLEEGSGSRDADEFESAQLRARYVSRDQIQKDNFMLLVSTKLLAFCPLNGGQAPVCSKSVQSSNLQIKVCGPRIT
ncbi:hypothetical protein SELMODRAFT_427340 [Selaginella moellendorffii]|uniref:Uncharacterized protein n=1 Tax=Selaginella moellendorffii TaxID=88036 RepID=D8SZ96_SELML|nr:hypothetical protein SELMODRAFT_427340 [Selaginella moellendorffii]